tara:strand:- start:770 stop:1171 length:402 start_codon:yes stop_codon:yes gene_type:complete
MIFSSNTLAKDRIAICESCNHFRKRTRTCGTPIKGNKIGSKRLCGCFMDIKTTLKFASCPMDKWIGLQITKKEYLEVKELLDNTQHRITNIQQQQLRLYSEKYLGLRVKSSSCSPCVKANLEKLKQIIEEYEK